LPANNPRAGPARKKNEIEEHVPGWGNMFKDTFEGLVSHDLISMHGIQYEWRHVFEKYEGKRVRITIEEVKS
jgi:hypothetical protein